MKLARAALLLLGFASVLNAQQERYTPPPGIAVPEQIRAELEQRLSEFAANLQELREVLKDKPTLFGLLPDVEVFHKAVRWPLLYGEFYRSNEFAIAQALLRQGME